MVRVVRVVRVRGVGQVRGERARVVARVVGGG